MESAGQTPAAPGPDLPAGTDAAPAGPGPIYTKGYKSYILFILFLINAALIIDHQILSILMEPIKLDLGLSDTQLGLLSGAAFALFHAIAGLPIARLADRKSRVNIMTICLFLWSGLTALSGLATNFTHLLLARIGVGIGEAGGTPPAHSLISDYFPLGKRGTAIGIHAAGTPIGLLGGLIIGGWMTELFSWRAAFFVVGVPGLILALLLKFTVKEPPRGWADGAPPLADDSTLIVAMAELIRCKTFRLVATAATFQAASSYGMAQWLPSYFMRVLGLSPGEAGVLLGLIIGISGSIGALSGGFIADRLQHLNVRWYLWLPALVVGLSLPLRILTFLVDDAYVASATLFVAVLLGAGMSGPEVTAVQSVVPPNRRALASAIMLAVTTMIGMGLGPVAVGVASDLLAPSLGPASLRYGIIMVCSVYLFAATFYFLASRHIAADIRDARQPAS